MRTTSCPSPDPTKTQEGKSFCNPKETMSIRAIPRKRMLTQREVGLAIVALAMTPTRTMMDGRGTPETGFSLLLLRRLAVKTLRILPVAAPSPSVFQPSRLIPHSYPSCCNTAPSHASAALAGPARHPTPLSKKMQTPKERTMQDTPPPALQHP